MLNIIYDASYFLPQPLASIHCANRFQKIISLSLKLRIKKNAPTLKSQEKWAKKPVEKRKYLSRREFSEIYGADEKDISKVKSFAKGSKLKIKEASASKRLIILEGTVKQVSAAFKVQFNDFGLGDATFYANDTAINIPASLKGIVTLITGFDNRPIIRRKSPSSFNLPPDTVPLTPPEVATLYDFPGNDASGQIIALLELGGGYLKDSEGRPQDVDAYMSLHGLPLPNVLEYIVPGGVNDNNPPGDLLNSGGMEVTMDIVVSASVARGATIVVYFSQNSFCGWVNGLLSILDDTVNDPSVLSISWGSVEDDPVNGASAAEMQILISIFQELAMIGVTVLAASGDNGSNCFENNGYAYVEYPASDPWVTGCGGTIISNVDKPKFKEGTWNDRVWVNDIAEDLVGFVGGATTGGFSKVFPAPSWQDINYLRSAGKPMRGVPDISGNASANSGYNIPVDGIYLQMAGTSAVAPLYAGLIAILNNKLGGRMGFINPLLYGLKRGFPQIFRDIADGVSNSVPFLVGYAVPPLSFPIFAYSPGYTSRNGWDPCTGLGVINGTHLLQFFTPTTAALGPIKKKLVKSNGRRKKSSARKS